MHNYVLIMAGGAGTRLWPLSRSNRPKQFQAFKGEETLLQHMVQLSTQVVPIDRIFVIAVPEFTEIIRQQIPGLPSENLLFEPERRDNGPAILLGMLHIKRLDPEARVAMLWSDHLIQESENFAHLLKACFTACEAHPSTLITVGVEPTSPDTGLGYIQFGAERGIYEEMPFYQVQRFMEKPDLETAQAFLNSGEYVWNTGYKIMQVTPFVEQLRQVQPDLVPLINALEQAITPEDITFIYSEFPKLSIEYLYTQYISDLLVVSAHLGWSDVGNWEALHTILKTNQLDGIVSKGEVISLHSKNNLIFAKDRPIAVIGLEDIVVVDDGDAILVMSRESAQHIKQLTNHLQEHNPELL